MFFLSLLLLQKMVDAKQDHGKQQPAVGQSKTCIVYDWFYSRDAAAENDNSLKLIKQLNSY